MVRPAVLALRRCITFSKNAFENSAILDILIPLLAFLRFKPMIVFPIARRRSTAFPREFVGNLLIHEFEPAFPKLDRTGLELRKSLPQHALRFTGKESVVAKRVAPKERKIGLELSDSLFLRSFRINTDFSFGVRMKNNRKSSARLDLPTLYSFDKIRISSWLTKLAKGNHNVFQSTTR